jgi:two-component system OmpR family response regulator
MRILLVEDNLPLAQALQQSLQYEGFLSIPDHDMVILDVGLPDMDGLLFEK